MARVITFATSFPWYHPKAGERTYFIEKFWESLCLQGKDDFDYAEYEAKLNPEIFQADANTFANLVWPKETTIREGNRWKAGDWFSPRVWGTDINPRSGRSGAYQSKQITFAPIIQIVKTWNIVIKQWTKNGDNRAVYINERYRFELSSLSSNDLSTNDGLRKSDFEDWFCLEPEFKKSLLFTGQILTWNEKIDY